MLEDSDDDDGLKRPPASGPPKALPKLPGVAKDKSKKKEEKPISMPPMKPKPQVPPPVNPPMQQPPVNNAWEEDRRESLDLPMPERRGPSVVYEQQKSVQQLQ